MSSFWKHIWVGVMLFAFASAFTLTFAPAAQAALGDEITNIATVSQETPDGRATLTTVPATFIIEARRTDSQIDFFRIAPNAPDAQAVQIVGSDYSRTGDPMGPFAPVSMSSTLTTVPPLGSSWQLIPATRYLPGELMIVRVSDLGQNGDPDVVETVVITVRADNGDQITLRLYEDGPNSGQFFGFFPSTAVQTPMGDTLITAPDNTVLTATYVDAFDASEVSIDTALVDPFGRVFDSVSGNLLNDVTVTIVDAATGAPAAVFGIDGVSPYPSTLQTGGSVTDAGGQTYQLVEGQFLFPLMAPGEYRLVIGEPAGYLFPSVREASDFTDINNAPFEIIPGSYGESFTVLSTGPLNLDVPLDPNGDLIARKDAAEDRASVGDFVGYTVELENAGNVPAVFNLRDTLPVGMRYVSGSARLNGELAADPDISENGRELTFTGGAVRVGEITRVTYLAVIGPGAQEGDLVNQAVALNSSGGVLSNVAEAVVRLEEDLLTSRLTIVGRVADAACSPDDEWARPLQDGIGIAGVRLYMETGRYVVTDEDGLYHFEGIKPGTHVVQIDEATLPQGYEPVICEENSRYAGSAISKFVDATGGTVWRANFYLKRNGEALEEVAEAAARVRDTDRYDQIWLDTQTDASPRWVYPGLDDTPSGRSVGLGLIHGPQDRVAMTLNGQPVSGLNYSGLDTSTDRKIGLSRWSGVDIQRGENNFVATVTGPNGEKVTTLQRTVWFVDEVGRARLVDDRSITVADGRTKPMIAVRLEDSDGHPVHAGRLVEIAVSDPYRLAQAAEREFEAPVSAAFSAVTGTRVGENGIAMVELEPTLQSGRVRLQVELQDGRIEDIDAWLQPEKREWVVVGLAEAEGLLLDLEEEARNDLQGDGRIAFFAKGLIKGDWLLTVAVDTAKRRGASDGELFDQIDPNAYYTLYGDRTIQYNDANSRYPVYVKLEREAAQILFGDFETDLTDTELGRYSRRLSGLKGDFEGETLSVTAFAAETNQGFVKDEIAADGTSGPYTLRQAPLIRSSEVIYVETRDRLRPDEIVSVRPLSRYVDYEIDYFTGELFFRHPVAAADAGFNPNVIVVDYEVASDVERKVTAGGRAAVRTEDGALEIGLTVIHEEDGGGQKSGPSSLVSADATLMLNEHTEIRAEAATSEADTELGEQDGEAWLIEASRRTEALSVTGYYREESEGFGLGQQSSATSALRRVGLQVGAQLGVEEVEGGSDRQERRVDAQTYREENLTTGARRDVADVTFRQESQALSLSGGVRAIAEDYDAAADPRQSFLLTGSVSKTFAEQGLTLTAAHEEPLHGGGSNDDDATQFPGRTVLGLDKTLGQTATLTLRHETTNGGNASGENTIAGISWTPRSGTQVRAATDMVTQDNAQRIGATVGVDQSWVIDENWSAGVGLASRRDVAGDDNPLDVAPDIADGPLENSLRGTIQEAYTSGYVGAGYRSEKVAGSGRIEVRKSQSGRRIVADLGGVREVSEALSFSAKARYQDEQMTQTAHSESLDVRFGAAWRPRPDGLVVLNRFDVGHAKIEGLHQKTKAVNNLSLNAMVTERTQVSVYNGIKYVEVDFEGAKESGFTHLIGAEARHDITKKVDIGVHGYWSSGEVSKTSAWAFGPSIGFTPKKNVWVSVGYNIEGFEDEDFQAAEYTRSGPYIKLRAKFDQDSFEGLIEGLGLGRDRQLD